MPEIPTPESTELASQDFHGKHQVLMFVKADSDYWDRSLAETKDHLPEVRGTLPDESPTVGNPLEFNSQDVLDALAVPWPDPEAETKEMDAVTQPEANPQAEVVEARETYRVIIGTIVYEGNDPLDWSGELPEGVTLTAMHVASRENLQRLLGINLEKPVGIARLANLHVGLEVEIPEDLKVKRQAQRDRRKLLQNIQFKTKGESQSILAKLKNLLGS